ncbi:MAG: hypothetical protein ACK4PR_09425 [Gammaproteobacteria bacterium]
MIKKTGEIVIEGYKIKTALIARVSEKPRPVPTGPKSDEYQRLTGSIDCGLTFYFPLTKKNRAINQHTSRLRNNVTDTDSRNLTEIMPRFFAQQSEDIQKILTPYETEENTTKTVSFPLPSPL